MTQDQFLSLLRENYKKMLLNKEETARELNISQGTLDNLRKEGKIKSKKILGQIFFDIGEVSRFMAEA